MKKEKEIKERINLKDSIGVFDNFIEPKLCKTLIEFFEKQKPSIGFDRIEGEGALAATKKDESVSYSKHNNWTNEMDQLCGKVRQMLDIYIQKTDFLNFSGIRELHFTNTKIQKTQPGGGYHVWHTERNYLNYGCSRALVWTVYLNDIEKGGETEFLNQNQRVPAKTGRGCIFPADFPYVHRGNPPLDKDKYIVTSWFLAT
tara:strand:+ start:545 stop:1147 length:603 start_codon:yes stop_codon:yes gene_type:complete